MTAAAQPALQPADHARPARAGWRGLGWVTWRQHRAALAAFLLLAALLAAGMTATGLVLHAAGPRTLAVGPNSQWHLFDRSYTVLTIVVFLLPALAGMFIGAPLVAREIETGTTRFAWTQDAGRARQLIATVLPIAALLALIAIALGLEFRWWLFPGRAFAAAWQPDVFGLMPLPLAGWLVFGFGLGVFLGVAIRRTLPAMAATFVCYAAVLYPVVLFWRPHYLPPLHQAGGDPTFSAGGGYGYSLGGSTGARPDVLSAALGWPDGRLLTTGELRHPAAWFRLHHIQIWVTYQPGTRLGLFHLIEFGWLIALSAVLIAATVLLIKRRPA